MQCIVPPDHETVGVAKLTGIVVVFADDLPRHRRRQRVPLQQDSVRRRHRRRRRSGRDANLRRLSGTRTGTSTVSRRVGQRRVSHDRRCRRRRRRRVRTVVRRRARFVVRTGRRRLHGIHVAYHQKTLVAKEKATGHGRHVSETQKSKTPPTKRKMSVNGKNEKKAARHACVCPLQVDATVRCRTAVGISLVVLFFDSPPGKLRTTIAIPTTGARFRPKGFPTYGVRRKPELAVPAPTSPHPSWPCRRPGPLGTRPRRSGPSGPRSSLRGFGAFVWIFGGFGETRFPPPDTPPVVRIRTDTLTYRVVTVLCESGVSPFFRLTLDLRDFDGQCFSGVSVCSLNN